MKKETIWAAVMAAVSLAIAAAGCGGSSSGGKTAAHEIRDLGSITIPASSFAIVSVDNIQTGGGRVHEIIFDSAVPIGVDRIESENAVFYDYDEPSGGVRWSDFLPFAPWRYYVFLLSGANTLGATLPVVHTLSGSYADGKYRFKITNLGPLETAVRVYQAVKTDPDFAQGALDLNLVVYTLGEPSPVVADEAEGIKIGRYIDDILSQAGVSVRVRSVEFRDDPEVVFWMETRERMLTYLQFLGRSTKGQGDVGINCFIMPLMPQSILGVDGSVPGPAFVHGVSGSALMALGTSYGSSMGGYSVKETDQLVLAKVLAHEIGHYLGLYHTSEKSGTFHDPLDDTPECGEDNDMDGDGIVSGAECRGKGAENLMFWSVSGRLLSSGEFQRNITEGQGQVVNTSPSVL